MKQRNSSAWDRWEREYDKLLTRKIAIEEELEEIESELSVLQSEREELAEAIQRIKQIDAAIVKEKAQLKKLEAIWNDLDKQDKRMADQEPEK